MSEGGKEAVRADDVFADLGGSSARGPRAGARAALRAQDRQDPQGGAIWRGQKTDLAVALACAHSRTKAKNPQTNGI